jgi:polysaccharide biosynthesis transport protein
VISRATVSNVPFSPKKLPTILVVTLTTLVLSAGFVVTKELLATPESMARVPAPPLAPVQEEHQEEVPPSRIASVLGMFRKKSPQRPEPRPEPNRREPVYRERAYQEPDYLDPAHQVPPHHIGAIDDVVADLSQNGSDGAPIAVFGAARGLDTSWTALKIARTLAETGSVILVGIGAADAAIRTASIDSAAGGLAEYADGSASFGKIITKDRESDVHLISSGRAPTDRREILVSETVPIAFEALSRSYDYVVIAAGAAGGPQLEDVAAVAPCAVLVAGTLTSAGTASARDRLLDAGYEDVTVVVGTTADLGTPAEAA